MARKLPSPRDRRLARQVLDLPPPSVVDVLDHVLNKGIVATGDVTLGVAGIDRNGVFILGDRITESATGLQNDAEIAVPVSLVRAQREALPDEVDGFIGSALLVREQPAVVQRVWLPRRDLEHTGVKLLRLG